MKARLRVKPEGSVVHVEWLLDGREFMQTLASAFPLISREEIEQVFSDIALKSEASVKDISALNIEETALKIQERLLALGELQLQRELLLEELEKLRVEYELLARPEDVVKEFLQSAGFPSVHVEWTLTKDEKVVQEEGRLKVRLNILNYRLILPVLLERFLLELPFPEPEEEDYINEPIYFAWSLKSYMEKTGVSPEEFLSQLSQNTFSPHKQAGILLVAVDYGLQELPEEEYIKRCWTYYKEEEKS